MDPSLTLAYETLAQVYEETGHPEEAAAAMEQANTLKSAQE
jgi:Tfp pilus assembly protein PilF